MLLKEVVISPEVIEEIHNELLPISSKKVFMDTLVAQRLAQIHKSETERFNSKLDQLDQRLKDTDTDILELARCIKGLSKFTRTLCTSTLNLFEMLDRYNK